MNTIKIDFRSKKMTDAFDLVKNHDVDSLYYALEDFEVFLCENETDEKIMDFARYKNYKMNIERCLRLLNENPDSNRVYELYSEMENNKNKLDILYQKYKSLGD